MTIMHRKPIRLSFVFIYVKFLHMNNQKQRHQLQSFIVLFFWVSVLVISGCTKSTTKIKEKIKSSIDNEFSKDFAFIGSAVPFLCYGSESNFWYDESVTGREILEDNFNKGYKGISGLDDLITEIKPYPEIDYVNNWIDSLHFAIDSTKRALREIQHQIDKVNSLFGLGLYGGISTLIDFTQLLSNNNDGTDKNMPMPQGISQRMNSLQVLIQYNYGIRFTKRLLDFKEKCIKECGSPKLDQAEKDTIKLFLTQLSQRKIVEKIVDKDDTICKDLIFSMFLQEQ